jgi:class 3 adenylate cyclase
MSDLEGEETGREPRSTHRDHQRGLTILFVDMVGSTPLAERLEAEELRDLVLRYHDLGGVRRRAGGGRRDGPPR